MTIGKLLNETCSEAHAKKKLENLHICRKKEQSIFDIFPVFSLCFQTNTITMPIVQTTASRLAIKNHTQTLHIGLDLPAYFLLGIWLNRNILACV